MRTATFLFLRLAWMAGVLIGHPAVCFAHPTDSHLPSLTAETAQRVVRSLEILVPIWGGSELPANAAALSALPGVIEDAVALRDGTQVSVSPTLLRALNAAGYPDSPYLVSQWKLDTERVLNAYAAVRSGEASEESLVVMEPLMGRLDRVVGNLL